MNEISWSLEKEARAWVRVYWNEADEPTPANIRACAWRTAAKVSDDPMIIETLAETIEEFLYIMLDSEPRH